MNRVEKAIKYIPCQTCHAKPGRPCSTKSGNPYVGKWFVHTQRVAPFENEFWAGVHYGQSMMRTYHELQEKVAASA